jgi:hypothetical protein
MSRWVGRAILAGLALLFVLRLVQLGRHGMPQVSVPRGSAAPELAGPLLSGDRFRLSEERGHPVVLAFWASWCGPCLGELPGVERVAEQLRQPPHTTRLIAVNTEGNRAAADATARRAGGFEIAAGKLLANRAALTAGRAAHQVLGALGTTREHPLGALTCRLWAWRSEYGDEHRWSTRLGAAAVRAGADGLYPAITGGSTVMSV